MKNNQLEAIILETVQAIDDPSPALVRQLIMQTHDDYSSKEIRAAIAQMWYDGRLNLSLDRKLCTPDL